MRIFVSLQFCQVQSFQYTKSFSFIDKKCNIKLPVRQWVQCAFRSISMQMSNCSFEKTQTLIVKFSLSFKSDTLSWHFEWMIKIDFSMDQSGTVIKHFFQWYTYKLHFSGKQSTIGFQTFNCHLVSYQIVHFIGQGSYFSTVPGELFSSSSSS